MSEPGEKEYHETCTSSDLPGQDMENLETDVLNRLHEEWAGSPISDDPVTARLQREQVIVRHKRQQRSRNKNSR